MIQVIFKTSDKSHQESIWPTLLPCRPMIGDFVSNEKGGILRIHAICFREPSKNPKDNTPNIPYLEIELK